MSMGYNSVSVFGGLVRDPEVRYGQGGGMAFLQFTLAVGFRVKNQQGEWEQRADYVPCKAFGRAAEIIGKYCRKGSRLMIGGRIKTESYEKDGRRVWSTYVAVNDLILGDRPDDRGGDGGGEQRPQQPSEHEQRKANGYAPDDGSDMSFKFRDGPSGASWGGDEADIPF